MGTQELRRKLNNQQYNRFIMEPIGGLVRKATVRLQVAAGGVARSVLTVLDNFGTEELNDFCRESIALHKSGRELGRLCDQRLAKVAWEEAFAPEALFGELLQTIEKVVCPMYEDELVRRLENRSCGGLAEDSAMDIQKLKLHRKVVMARGKIRYVLKRFSEDSRLSKPRGFRRP